MRSFNRIFFKSFLVILLIALLSFPQISLAISRSPVAHNNITTPVVSGNPYQKSKPAIIAKDAKSGAVIYKNRNAYFYGFSRAAGIVTKGQVAPREFIVKFKNSKNTPATGEQRSIKAIMGKFAGQTEELNRNLGLTLVQLPKERNYFKTLKELSKNPDVAYAEPNFVVKAQYIPDDPYYSKQWGLQMIKAESAWNKVARVKRAKVTIAILDTGINFNHEDLKDNIILGYDFANNDNNLTDVVGHGTHISGIAAAVINNGKGIAGVAGGSKIMPLKVLDDTGSGTDADIIKGIKYATDHGAQVISMSLGGPGSSDALQDAINYAIGRGVNVVVAAGNENGEIDTPGNCQGVITVGAVASDGKRADYSNFGPKLDVMAPGSDIMSTYIDSSSSYTVMTGTSMATPFVTGVVALIKAANPNLSPAEVIDIIHRSASDLGEPGFDDYYGYGLLNADKAVDLALQQAETPSPGTDPNLAPEPKPEPAPVSTPAPTINPVPNAPAVPVAAI